MKIVLKGCSIRKFENHCHMERCIALSIVNCHSSVWLVILFLREASRHWGRVTSSFESPLPMNPHTAICSLVAVKLWQPAVPAVLMQQLQQENKTLLSITSAERAPKGSKSEELEGDNGTVREGAGHARNRQNETLEGSKDR